MILINFGINGPAYSDSKCVLPEGNYSTTTLVAAMCDVTHAHYPFGPHARTCPKTCAPHANLVNNTVSIYNGTNKFELLTDAEALEDMYLGRLTGCFPLCSVNATLLNTTPKLIETSGYCTSGDVDLHPIRAL